MRPAAHLALAVVCWSVLATPVRIIDADTFTADARVFPGLTSRETVRVLGVDAPEMKGTTRAAGVAAHAFAVAWFEGDAVRLHVCQRDAFGRLLGTVTRLRDGANLATDLIAAGHGQPRGK